MTTFSRAHELPNTVRPLAFAVASALALPWVMSEGGNSVFWGVVFVAVLGAVLLSTRYTVRTYRRLAENEFQLAHTLKWLTLSLALAINGVVCLMMAGSAILVLGVLITGRGVAG